MEQPKQRRKNIFSKITLTNNNYYITRATQEKILTVIKDLLKNNDNIKNIKISHYHYKYITIDFKKYLDHQDFLSIIKKINETLFYIIRDRKILYIKDYFKDKKDILLSYDNINDLLPLFYKCLEDEEDNITKLKHIKNFHDINHSLNGALISYTYKTNEGQTEPRKHEYKYSYKPSI